MAALVFIFISRLRLQTSMSITKNCWLFVTERKQVITTMTEIILQNYNIVQLCHVNCVKYCFEAVFFNLINRAAARCNKGVKVLVTAVVEHFVFTAVHIYRGSRFADKCAASIKKVLHCQLCEERTFLPNTCTPLGKICTR